MNWSGLSTPKWPGKISNEDAKTKIGEKLAARAQDGQVIGIGSGSTSFLALLALAQRVNHESLAIRCVPTSLEIESYCTALGLSVTTLVNSRPDWAFDGADEIDPGHNLIKGRGGAFVREQLVFASAPKRVILVDESKFVPTLGEKFSVPLAVVPEAANLVRMTVSAELGTSPTVRPAGGKDGGVIDEQGSLVMDLKIDGSRSPSELERFLLTVPGISATGLFVGYEMEVIT
ncbi:MAG: ribose 5-phosphate isomerase A [Actinomycetes bacterium]|jgi:ribose 5-phosphate isomerase A